MHTFDKSLTWEGVKWLVQLTSLPVIAKGVLRAEDALKAIEAGCQGIIVSNHGGRNVDTTPATVCSIYSPISSENELLVYYLPLRSKSFLRSLKLCREEFQ